MEDRTWLEFEASVLRAPDLGAGQVGRQQVGSELHAGEVSVQALRQRAVPAVAPPPPPPGLGALYGAGVGGVLMLFATGGPLLLAWLARRGFDARAMRATTPALIVVAVLMVLGMMAANGRLSSPLMWQRLLVLLPIAVIGVLVGHALAHRVPVATLRRVICALLVVSGVMLMLNAVNRML